MRNTRRRFAYPFNLWIEILAINDETSWHFEDLDTVGIEKAIDELTETQAKVLRLRFGYYGGVKTLEEVGKKIRKLREQVRQIELKALCRLKHPSFRKQFDKQMQNGRKFRQELEIEKFLSRRVCNLLTSKNVRTANDLMGLDFFDLYVIRGIGKQGLLEITSALRLMYGFEYDLPSYLLTTMQRVELENELPNTKEGIMYNNFMLPE